MDEQNLPEEQDALDKKDAGGAHVTMLIFIHTYFCSYYSR
jgi:hypothetical protein